MKTISVLLLFVVFVYSNSFAQNSYTDNIVNDKSEYAGVYEGNIDVGLCCDVYETGFGKISFFFDGDSINCFYDGKIIKDLFLYNDLVKHKDIVNDNEVYPGTIFGRFSKDKNGKVAFLDNFEESEEHTAGSISVLEKIGGADAAQNLYRIAAQEMNEFNIFESIFKEALFRKNEEQILKLVNFPFYDKRLDWEKPVVISNKIEFKSILKSILLSHLYDTSYKYQDSNKNFSGTFTIFADKMFFYFKKSAQNLN